MRSLLLLLATAFLLTSCYNCWNKSKDDVYNDLSPDRLALISNFKEGDMLIFKSNTGLYDTAYYGKTSFDKQETYDSYYDKHKCHSVYDIVFRYQEVEGLGDSYPESSRIMAFFIDNIDVGYSLSNVGGGYKFWNNPFYSDKDTSLIINETIVDSVLYSPKRQGLTFPYLSQVYFKKQLGVLRFDYVLNSSGTIIVWERVK